MSKKKFLFCLVPALLATGLTGCAPETLEGVVLRVLNMEDYIYEQDIEEGYEEEDLVVQFEEYAREEGYDVTVVYDTTDTNETLYSELQTGKAFYDVICPSDYMCQKLGTDNLLYKLTDEDKALVPNYFGEDSPASKRIKGTLDNISFTKKATKESPESVEYLGDYAVGYMWGTLGMIFNPEYSTYEKRDISSDDVISDMQTWDSLWEKKYKNTFSIKDSMRDTYAVGVLKTYEEELQGIQKNYLEAPESEKEAALATYQQKMGEIFNKCSPEDVKNVYPNLKALKDNSFGLECDSGKQDIVTGKIGINVAWSGDAVYSMDQAEDEKGIKLCYSIPEIGSNIWFDAWVIPNTARTETQKTVALMFLNFLCDPEIVAENMDYIGYTSFIGGDAIIDLVRDWYDYRTNYLYAEVEDEETEELYYYTVYHTPEGGEETAVEYSDFFGTDNGDETLYYYIEDDEGNPTGDPIDFVDPMADEGDETVMKFSDLLTVLDEVEVIDLSYFFEGTLQEYGDEDMIFYSDEYLPYKNEDGTQNISVGRQFFCQYPSLETINRCAVMRDYGENNKTIMKMWEEFKSNPLPTWAIILFAAEGAAIVIFVVYFLLKKKAKKDIRHKRREKENN